MTISDERVERAAKLIAAKQCSPARFERFCMSVRDVNCTCRRDARAALEADAPAIAEAEARGRREELQIMSTALKASATSILAARCDLGNEQRAAMFNGINRSTAELLTDMAARLDSRIAALQPEIDANG